MYSKLIKSSFLILVLVISICIISSKPNYAQDIECLQRLADSTINMLVATRSVIAKNQDLINIDPITGNYYFKGFVPALVGSEIANDFSLMTGHKLKQTSLKLRNPNNKPDEWEKKINRAGFDIDTVSRKSMNMTMKAIIQCEGFLNSMKMFVNMMIKPKVSKRMVQIMKHYNKYGDYFGYGIYCARKTEKRR